MAEGAFTPEGGTPVALDGSSFEVADTRIKGTDAKLRLQVAGPVQAVLDDKRGITKLRGQWFDHAALESMLAALEYPTQ